MSETLRTIDPALNGWNAEYIDAQYRAYLDDPSSVAADMRRFFQGYDLAASSGASAPAAGGASGNAVTQARVWQLIERYREHAHHGSAIDPFGRPRDRPNAISLEANGLTDADRAASFDPGTLPLPNPSTLADIIEFLDNAYLGPCAFQFTHIDRDEEREWLRERFEQHAPQFSRGERSHILYQLHRAELFELFCGKRYPGVKRFSLEGLESLIPMLDRIVEDGGDRYDVDEVVLAMSHRGRLNVLTNIVGKTYEQIFTEFDDAWEADAEEGGGDVKYHRGFSASRVLPSGKHVWLAMSSNPSHLESVAPVAIGRCRAKQRVRGDLGRQKVFPVIMHGDAAFIGQGVVAETFNMAQLDGYTVGGTIHIVVNNLIGFTTGPDDSRSSDYCTDIAKMIGAPIIHVNAEDPDACVRAAIIALDYRMKFHRDVVIDLVGYRRHGHNESDEAAYTQPLLYAQIKKKPSVVSGYAQRLLEAGVIQQSDVDSIKDNLGENLDKAYLSARETPVDPTPDPGHQRWVGLKKRFSHEHVDTGVQPDDLRDISKALGSWPDSFTPHRKLIKTLEARTTNVHEDKPLDWATCEQLAVGSLLIQGVIVRMSGQDSRRGTFSHRHAVLRDMNNAEEYVPLNHIRELGVAGEPEREVGTVDDDGRIRQARYCIYDSPLSEFSVLGFEYGFSLSSPNMLVLWEAQFGDFANSSQVIIDQFIASAESKWHRWSGLTMLLPHGYEGQGPEHSSARLERFLKLSGQDNWQIIYPSTPAQYFHALRRQVMRNFRKPLIVMTPKSLLRFNPSFSSVADLQPGTSFEEVIDDPNFSGAGADKSAVKRLLLCSGKVYYDLSKRREESGREDVAIVRVEQLYPLHLERLKDVCDSYANKTEIAWVQEEPGNMGAWGHMALSFVQAWGWELPLIGRESSASPATGSPKRHAEELESILNDAIGPVDPERAASKNGTRAKAGIA